ncbi:MAG: type II secretion system F family protein [Planctomycetota bacterium]|jgi:general secretion pathway protein F/type IV pilus assembly protein PilC
MPSFSYKAVNDSGAPVTGVLTAENYQVALRLLEEQALYPVKVQEGLQGSALGSVGRRKRVKLAHLTVFYSQMADLLRAGVPMLRALDVLARQASGGILGQIVKELREDVAGGMSLGDAMAKHPAAFSDLHASMVRAGEQGGFLEDVLERIAIFTEKQDELKNKVIGSMIYPCILVFAGTTVVLLLMLFVVPKLREYLRPETFNVLTHIVFGFCDILFAHYVTIIVGVVAAFFAFSWAVKTETGKQWLEQFKLKAPLFGGIMTMVAICRFCRILGTMLHNGVPILQALRISKDSAGNKILADLIGNAADSVKKGAPLSDPLKESGLFPPAVVDMIAVAEEGNNLESVLIQIADTNEARTARQIELAVRILEPILLVMMALAVFCIALAILLPILTMGTGI